MKKFDEKFFQNLVQTVLNETSGNISKEIELYLNKTIESKRWKVFDSGNGKISEILEYMVYSAVLANRIGKKEFLEKFQDLMIPAGFMDEEDKILEGYK